MKAALLVTKSVGFEGLTMREVAEELGIGTMTIYNYVPNREALVELIVEHVLEPVHIPSPDVGSWDERLLELHRSIRSLLRRHRGLPVSDASAIARLGAEAKALIAERGFSPTDARLAFDALWTLMVGRTDVDDAAFEFAFESVVDTLKRRPAQRRAEPRQRR